MKYLWDFIFGVLLIGGAPWSVIALLVVVGDFLQQHAGIVLPDITMHLTFILAIIALGAAIHYRFRRRVLPKNFIIAEILFGLIAAFGLFMFYGVIVHSIID